MREPRICVDVFSTSLGWIAICGRPELLASVAIGHRSPQTALEDVSRACGVVPSHGPSSDGLKRRLIAFAEGEEVDFSDVPLDLSHLTAFQRKIVKHCRKIPRGQTRTYGQLAAEAGSPAAARAVGNVMAANRFPLIVPCHRVVAADGGLGGFSAPQGTRLKRQLLQLEQPCAVA